MGVTGVSNLIPCLPLPPSSSQTCYTQSPRPPPPWHKPGPPNRTEPLPVVDGQRYKLAVTSREVAAACGRIHHLVCGGGGCIKVRGESSELIQPILKGHRSYWQPPGHVATPLPPLSPPPPPLPPPYTPAHRLPTCGHDGAVRLAADLPSLQEDLRQGERSGGEEELGVTSSPQENLELYKPVLAPVSSI